MHSADWIALWALVVAVISLGVAVVAICKSNRNSSVATLVTLSEATREAWLRFLSARAEQKFNELADLMNLLEIACAILNEGSLVGVSKHLIEDYLNEVIGLLREDSYSSAQIEQMFSSPTTFEHVRKFYNAKQSQPLSVTAPRQWFQSE